ncbi:lambda exonuclease family protein [Antarcticirhabdus aurantiaca]|uniref:YqaJ viral recombinase family protein n=1 Tax=Antarcticirhabdus aurantiaca TaxID=2606717 RepID=A0ACD4NL71_9HYPH|nr:YqaJ viral recombinase family protein [Jeongeuplla avenae]
MSQIVQGSPEWHAVRTGKVTASRVADIIAKTKTGPAASRANYLGELVAERLTGVPAESFSSPAMRWGTETEPQARAAYCFYRDADVTEIGFVPHPVIPSTGASPDGLVGDDGLIEIKCPNTATHVETLLSGTIASKYVTQMQWQMACTGRAWCDFVSFDPRMPGEMQIFIQRVERDDAVIAELEEAVVSFLGELEAKLAALAERFRMQEAA